MTSSSVCAQCHMHYCSVYVCMSVVRRIANLIIYLVAHELHKEYC